MRKKKSMTKKISIYMTDDDRIVLTVGKQTEAIRFEEGYAQAFISEQDSGVGIVQLDFIKELSIPEPRGNSINITMKLPNSTENESN
jgi:hypothetical protein